ncbi:hypothetical protein EW145_g1042 [Phellinidium pouzarii]|uniref:Uncharacterized protein n=1 Tax=Phellinidium pouzarii TaxID=167371 RepID=A0A4S4LLH3_9AGAM|nr:hypothetical protein EW145_g1042 [Phellinidium pouzarii]
MGRTHTTLKVRNSPARGGKSSGNKTSSTRSVFKVPRTPTKDKTPRSPFEFKPLRQSLYNRPVIAPKNNLYTIREESPEEMGADEGRNNRVARNISTASNCRDSDMDELYNSGGDCSSEASDFEGWDDETTLVAKFQESLPEQSDREKLVNLAYELEGPMQARGDLLKQYLAHTMAPAARKVKNTHKVLEEKVDVAFGVGVLSFDDSCKKIEQLSLQDEEGLSRIYMDTQRNVRELFRQLKDAYKKRDQLWDSLQDSVDKGATRALATLSSLPTGLDDTAAAIEKKSKEVSKSGGMDGKAKQKFLRELLAEM